MTRIAFIIIIAFLGALAACDENRIYEKNKTFENKEWLADSTQAFDFKIKDTTLTYNLYYNIRNTISYPFQNIYVQYTLKDSTDKELDSQLINNDLFDPKTGKPYGDGLGDVFDHQFPILKNYSFDQAGKYTITLQQFMRRDTLPDIIATGIRLEKVTEDNIAEQ
ncbi:gliding motility lipoprotein GldH [Fulvivirga maritima]|uniref:gliding motility lipoprotein GldH n=1 Tax=Fulvivirga maritima TaxID=2904247 RepID=UPI001F1DF253|nr:gliding motility lipoprotein GldH [Fulvivirga maritima]UII27808.1 gliding motility lipoprotein GldH [Fulvivirga maritima]